MLTISYELQKLVQLSTMNYFFKLRKNPLSLVFPQELKQFNFFILKISFFYSLKYHGNSGPYNFKQVSHIT